MIHKIEAREYGMLKSVSQELQPFQVVVGPNASGKSTFLDVPVLVRDFVKYGTEAVRARADRIEDLIFRQSADSFHVALELLVTPDMATQLQDPSGAPVYHDTVRYEVAFGKGASGTSGVEVRREDLWLKSSSQTAPDRLIIRRNIDTLRTYVRSDEYSEGEDGGQERDGQVSATHEYNFDREISSLSQMLKDRIRYPLTTWAHDLLRSDIHVLTLNLATTRLRDEQALRRVLYQRAERGPISLDQQDLTTLIKQLKQMRNSGTDEYVGLFDDWLHLLNLIQLDIDDIEVIEPPGSSPYLAVRYAGANEVVPQWLVSDGTMRMIALTLLGYLPQQSQIYLIEEPENGIHPPAIEAVFRSLSSARAGQVIVATHSPGFVRWAKPGDLLCFTKNADGSAQIVPGDEHYFLQNLEDLRDIDLGVLFESGVLS